jgi:hypothetical protein
MRRSLIWFLLAIFWGADSVLALFRHNSHQAALTAFFACCFLAVGIALRARELKLTRR